MPSDEPDLYWRILQAGLDMPTLAERLDSLRPSWHRRAECRGADTADFFPSYRAEHAPGQALCALCEVRAECGAVADRDPGLSGTWGGLTEHDRIVARREQRAA